MIAASFYMIYTVNSITFPIMSGNLSEISLKSNDVSPSISSATTTPTSAFSFISNPGEHIRE